MKIPSLNLPSVLALALCATLAACTNSPPREPELDYQSRPLPAAREGSQASPTGQRLSIEAGEGEKLNLPWFIQDTQNWINRQ